MATKGFRLLLALFLAVNLFPDDASADLYSLFSGRTEDSSENEAEKVHAIFVRLFEGFTGKLGKAADDVRTATEKFADGVKSAVEGAANDAGEVIGAIANKFNPTIFPGTKWCGAGSLARGFDDVGVFGTADHCCRAHDSCPDVILAGETKNGLKNDGQFTLSNCECDDGFYWCLKNSTSLVAKKVGITFFNILRTKCYTNGSPSKCEDGSPCAYTYGGDAATNAWRWVDAKRF